MAGSLVTPVAGADPSCSPSRTTRRPWRCSTRSPSDAGWATLGFSQLSEFERAVAERVPDLVILDDDLPDGRGGDRARELQRDRRLRNVPVLVCTAASLPRQAEIGAWVPVVSKPFDLGEIERILDAVARKQALPVHRAAG